jgi:hypothetical protein
VEGYVTITEKLLKRKLERIVKEAAGQDPKLDQIVGRRLAAGASQKQLLSLYQQEGKRALTLFERHGCLPQKDDLVGFVPDHETIALTADDLHAAIDSIRGQDDTLKRRAYLASEIIGLRRDNDTYERSLRRIRRVRRK